MRLNSQRDGVNPSNYLGMSYLISVIVALLGFIDAHASPLQPKPISDEAYGESFTAIADLADGTYVLTQFVFTNAGFGDGKAACRGLVVRRGEKGLNDAKRYSRSEWKYVANGNVLKVGECTLASANGQTTFSVKTDTLTIDLLLQDAVKAVKPPNHRVNVDDDEFYDAEILIPWAKVTASINTPKGKIVSSGRAYLDHTRSNTRLPKVADKWLRFRGFHGSTPVLMSMRYAPGKHTPTGWLWHGPEGKPIALKTTEITVKDGRGGPMIIVQTGQGPLTVKTSAVVYRYRPAKEWGLLGRLAKPWVGDPETRTFKAKISWPDGRETRGILERATIKDD